MMRSLFSGVSGLKNHQTRMDVIGNNIANVNTTGFKASRVNFQDILSQTLSGASSAQGNRGGTNPMQVGLGVALASIDTLFTPGSYQTTGKQTDLAIQDQGFFVLANGNEKYYTRAGNFDFDVEGNYVVPGTGLKVVGWMADNAGEIDALKDPTTIKIPVGEMMEAQRTDEITYGKNLSAGAKKTGTSAERATADADKLAADAAKATADADLTAANTAKTNADNDLAAANTAKAKADAAKSAIDTAATAIANALAAATTYQTTSNLTTATAAQAAAAAAVTQAAAAVGAATADTSTQAAQLKVLADALKSATDAAVGNPTLAANVTAVYNAADDANTYTPTAQTAAANAVTTATANQSAAATAAATAATNQTAAATIAANAATVATKAAEAVKAAYDESSKVQTEVTVYDSQGNAYKLKGIFEKTADNTWTFTLGSDAVNADGDVIGTVSPTAVATLKFDSKGAYDSLNSVINSITIDPTGGPYAGAGSFTAKTDFSTMTQYASESTAKATAQNGWADGTLNGVTIDSTGTIVGNFTNGKTKDLARVAMAVFNNPAGLNKAGQNLYTESNNSGIADVGASGTGGRGTFTAGTLEMSNVDLSQEFSNMIITQRGFQANSKIITTSDEMLEILANLKR